MTISFGSRLRTAFDSVGHLCVGIDPHPYLLASWNLPDSGKGLREFGLRTVEAAVGHASVVKPQVAFFERHGSRGYEALEETIAAARAAGILVLADAKRGDLGTSVEAYAQSWLREGSPLESDAMTLSAYQGVGSLDAPMRLALNTGKGLFILAATSNPESFASQQAVLQTSALTVAASIVDDVSRKNAAPLGSFGVVIGATVDLASYGIAPASLSATPILAPGFGFQGAMAGEVHDRFGEAAANVVVSSSRAILELGPSGISSAIAGYATELASVFAA